MVLDRVRPRTRPDFCWVKREVDLNKDELVEENERNLEVGLVEIGVQDKLRAADEIAISIFPLFFVVVVVVVV